MEKLNVREWDHSMLILSRLGGINFAFCTGSFSPSCNDAEEFFLFEGHLPGAFFRPLMLIANQVKHAMDHQKDHHFHIVETETARLALGCFNRNHQVSEEMRMEGRELSFSHGEGQDIGRFVPTEVLPIQGLNLKVIHEQEADLGLKKPQFGQYPLGRPSYFS